MDSPKIRPDLIPKLWRLAKARKIPMTRLVNDLREESLIGEEIPDIAESVTDYPQARDERGNKGR